MSIKNKKSDFLFISNKKRVDLERKISFRMLYIFIFFKYPSYARSDCCELISLFFEKGKYLIKAPIGSGKSFLFFDGITYGLYKSNSRNLLNIPSKIGTIKLIFEVDGQVFLVIRTLKHGKSKDSCSSQLFQIALTSEEVTEKLCV